MSSFDQAMALLTVCGLITAAAALMMVRRLDRLERQIRERDAAARAAE